MSLLTASCERSAPGGGVSGDPFPWHPPTAVTPPQLFFKKEVPGVSWSRPQAWPEHVGPLTAPPLGNGVPRAACRLSQLGTSCSLPGTWVWTCRVPAAPAKVNPVREPGRPHAHQPRGPRGVCRWTWRVKGDVWAAVGQERGGHRPVGTAPRRTVHREPSSRFRRPFLLDTWSGARGVREGGLPSGRSHEREGSEPLAAQRVLEPPSSAPPAPSASVTRRATPECGFHGNCLKF